MGEEVDEFLDALLDEICEQTLMGRLIADVAVGLPATSTDGAVGLPATSMGGAVRPPATSTDGVVGLPATSTDVWEPGHGTPLRTAREIEVGTAVEPGRGAALAPLVRDDGSITEANRFRVVLETMVAAARREKSELERNLPVRDARRGDAAERKTLAASTQHSPLHERSELCSVSEQSQQRSQQRQPVPRPFRPEGSPPPSSLGRPSMDDKENRRARVPRERTAKPEWAGVRPCAAQAPARTANAGLAQASQTANTVLAQASQSKLACPSDENHAREMRIQQLEQILATTLQLERPVRSAPSTVIRTPLMSRCATA